MCGAHLAGHIELFTALESAYLSKSFADLVHHPSVIALVTTAKEAEDDTDMEPSGPRAKSSSNGNLQTAFEEPYLGVAHTRFIAALEYYSSYGDNKKPYMKSISVIQSSGMGKSRMVEEAAKTVFTIPANIREPLPRVKKKKRQAASSRICYLLKHIFATAKSKFAYARDYRMNKSLTLAAAWADYLNQDQTPEEVGTERRALYDQAVGAAITERLMIATDRYDSNGVRFQELKSSVSLYSLFRKICSTGWVYPSLRVYKGTYLIPPFTELPFDIFANQTLQELSKSNQPWSLENACTVGVMSSMGRPMWFVHHKLWNDQKSTGEKPLVDHVISFARMKLTAGAADSTPEAELAALSARIGLTFESISPTAREMESRQVELYMRIVYAIPEHREYMRTGSSSEPVLAEAAARYLYEIHGGFLAKGERGELCGRLLMTIAHDIALMKKPYSFESPLEDPLPRFHRPIPLLDFLLALFAEEHHSMVLNATPILSQGDAETLETRFQDAFVSFSHFALAENSDVFRADALQVALFRGVALQAKDNQPSIDAVIPIHMGSTEQAITMEAVSAINLQFKNRKRSLDCPVNRTITVPDPKKPVISIVFEFGETDSKLPYLEVHHQECRKPRIKESNKTTTHPDEHHYSFVARGCGPKTYRAIPEEAVPSYQTILASGDLMNDFPRAELESSWEGVRELKPTLDAKELLAGWNALRPSSRSSK
ncbi:hypothetical protein RHS01_11366 [Rhizoctonia solani]|uniref:Uncharacterized protein n=1 Tax=Rhizoctonia solani TaxID=456999 RepID=A0A8H7I350_9AGAM|nr:hypothetical protein RHS01_11366 [Rhizoctonia solani]